MSFLINFVKYFLPILFSVVFLVFPQTVFSQYGAQAVGPDSARQAEFEPYQTRRSFGYHLLAVPSYALDLVAWPIGKGMKLMETEFPRLFKGERGNFGVYPFFETGGETGTAYGALIFNRNFFGSNHHWRIEALFGSSSFNDFDLEYTIPGLFESEDKIEFSGNYSNDPVESLFIGNDIPLDQETRYSIEEASGDIEYSIPVFDVHSVSFRSAYTNAIIRQSEVRDEELDPFPQILKGRTELVELGTSFRLDFAEGEPRTYTGRRFRFDARYHHSLDDNQFAFFNYMAEWQEFLVLPFLPETRRLAFRSRLERVEPLAGKNIPFFKLPSIGDSKGLRGLAGDRYRDDGSLLLTLEYRYPMWDFIDVVLFVDEGQVFQQFGDISIADFHTGYGFGVHFLSANNFSFRIEFAFSKESSRTILSISPNF